MFTRESLRSVSAEATQWPWQSNAERLQTAGDKGVRRTPFYFCCSFAYSALTAATEARRNRRPSRARRSPDRQRVLDSPQRLRVLLQVLGQELEGDVPPQAKVLRLVNLPHSAAAQLLKHSIMRNNLPQHERRTSPPSRNRRRAGHASQCSYQGSPVLRWASRRAHLMSQGRA